MTNMRYAVINLITVAPPKRFAGTSVLASKNTTSSSTTIPLPSTSSPLLPKKVRRDQRFSKHGHNLRIERVGPKDNGEYTCEVATIIFIIVVFFIDVFTEVKS